MSARIGYIALCLVGFLLSSELVRAALPGQGTPLTETKLAHFAEHADDYDTLFFGSSRAYRGIAPEVFDATLAGEGIECRTFSFGAPGARATDIYNTLCKLQRLQPTGLRFVFIDPERLEFLAGHDDMLQSSVVDWHDAESSWLAVKYVLAAGQPPARVLREIGDHLEAFLYRAACIGAAHDQVLAALGRGADSSLLVEGLGPRRDGWRPLNLDEAEARAGNHERFLKNFASYEQRRARLAADRVDETPVAPEALVFLTRLVDKVEELGAQPIFYVQPGMKRQHDLIKAAREGAVEHLLRCDLQAERPQLFDPEQRWDAFHLNERGARLQTEMLARDFAAMYKTGRFER